MCVCAGRSGCSEASGGRLQSQACIGKSFDRFLSRVRFRGQSLHSAARTRAAVPNLARISTQFIWTNRRIGFQLPTF